MGYGVFANIGSGAASGGQVPGGSGNHGFGKVRRFRGRFRTTGFGAGFGAGFGRFQNGSGQVSRL